MRLFTGDKDDKLAESYVHSLSPHGDTALPEQTGHDGQYLKTNGTVADWAAVSDAVWGSITGTLANQTDLSSALSGKSDTSHGHSGVYEPANSNIQSHVTAAHAPSDAVSLTTVKSDSDVASAISLKHAVGSDNQDLSGYSLTSHNHDLLYSALAHNHTGVYDASGTASGLISTHESTYAHSNIHASGSDNQDLSGYSLTAHGHSGVYEPANSNIQSHVTSAHAPSDAVSLSTIKADSDVASAISLKHAAGSDNQDLSGLVVKETGKGLSTNDLTAGLKTNYDTAYSHSQVTHAPTDAVTLTTVKADTVISSAISLKHAAGSDNQDLSGLVVKETGKSLVADTEIAKIHASGSDNQDLSGYQTTANKVNSFQVTPDDTHYPSEKLVKDSLDGKSATHSHPYESANANIQSHIGSTSNPHSVTASQTGAQTQAQANLLYAPIAKGVTNGDSHDHSGGDGAQIAYSGLSGTPTIPVVSGTAGKLSKFTAANTVGDSILSESANSILIPGQAAMDITESRNTTSNTAGNRFTVQAGGATSGATDKNGGTLILSGGISTGIGVSSVEIKTAVSGTSGTTDRTPTTMLSVVGGKVGIGTDNPSYFLSIESGHSLANNTTIDGTVFGGTICFRQKGTSTGISGDTYAAQLFASTASGNLEIYNAAANYSLVFGTNATERMRIRADGGVTMSAIKSGATQAAASAAAGELWKTSGHATLPDNVVMIGV